MSFPRYPAYKDSGVPWFGEVPKHWQVAPLKAFIDRIESGVSVNATDTPAEGEQFGVLKTSCVYKGQFDAAENKAVVNAEYDRVACPVAANTLIVSRMNTPDLVGAAGLTKADHATLFLPDRLWQVFPKGTRADFMHFWTRTASYRAQVEMACAGTSSSMQNLGQDDFRSFMFVSPPPNEQAVIADFLGRETAKIDALVAEQEQLITLLKEKRQAVISHAVTKGLDPSVPMKDSGVEWLGQVPAHWGVAQFRRHGAIAEGQVNPEDSPYSEMVLIAPNHVEAATGRLIAQETAAEQGAESGKYLCAKGDVIYSKIRPALRKVCLAPVDCLCSADMYPLKPHSGLKSDFLLWYMLSEGFSTLAVLESERVAMPKINRETLNPVPLVIPPEDEQHSISEYLSAKTDEFDRLTAEATDAIALLQERRSALISAAVTGQIDVRGLASLQEQAA